MYLNNPLRPGSVTTDILADGAVTCVKTDFTACNLSLSDVSLSGTIAGGTLKPATVLAVVYGGTGTSTPSIVAGTAISIGGTWPNQTINNTSNYATLADPLPVAHGGTGTSTPSLVAGTSISIGGTWPNQTINNTSNYASLAMPLPVINGGTGSTTLGSNIPSSLPVSVSQGGTGLTSPSLVSSTNITVSGTWPNQTITLNSSIYLTSVYAGDVTGNGTIRLASVSNHAYIIVYPDNVSGDYNPLSITSYGTSHFIATFGGTNGTELNENLTIYHLIVSYNGNSLVGVGIPSLVAQVNLQDQSANISNTTLLTPSAAGMYRISGHLLITNTSGGSSAQQIVIEYTYRGTTFTVTLATLSTGSGGKFASDGIYIIYVDASTNIIYNTQGTLQSGDTFDAHIRLEPI